MTDDHSKFDDEAKALLSRAYSLKDEAQTKELYAAWAKTYDDTMLVGLGYLTPKNTAALLAQHVAGKQSRILDVGSGTGLAGVELKAKGFNNLDALDYSSHMLAVASHRGVYKNLLEVDLNQPLSISDNQYDAMICTGTFTHAHVGAGCLDELFRILKPDGYFACTVHKDVWQPQGFDAKQKELSKAGIIDVVFQEMGKYYTNSTEGDGYYIIWQKRG